MKKNTLLIITVALLLITCYMTEFKVHYCQVYQDFDNTIETIDKDGNLYDFVGDTDDCEDNKYLVVTIYNDKNVIITKQL